MALRLGDLPANLRSQIEAQAGTPRRKRNRTGAGATRTDGRCECGEPFTSTTAWERHSDTEGVGHRRFLLIITQEG